MAEFNFTIEVETNDEVFNKLVSAFRDLAEIISHPVVSQKDRTYALTINEKRLKEVIDELLELQFMLAKKDEKK